MSQLPRRKFLLHTMTAALTLTVAGPALAYAAPTTTAAPAAIDPVAVRGAIGRLLGGDTARAAQFVLRTTAAPGRAVTRSATSWSGTPGRC